MPAPPPPLPDLPPDPDRPPARADRPPPRAGGPLRPLLVALALVLIAEEWLWLHLAALVRRLTRVRWVVAMEDRARRLGPYASLLALCSPAVVLFPFKLLGMWALAQGHPVAGLAVVVAAKLCGTAAAAYVLDLVGTNARRVRWFAWVYDHVAALLARCHAWVRASAAYRVAKDVVARVRRLAARLVATDRPASRSVRAWRRLRAARARRRDGVR